MLGFSTFECSARSAILAFTLTIAVPCMVVGAALVPSADNGLADLMNRLALRQHGHVSFVERQFLGILDRATETSGELLYDAPDRLEKRTLKPKPESLILDHGTLAIQRGKYARSLSLRDYPHIGLFIDSIRETLAGDLAALNRSYTLAFKTGSDGWTLVLIPRDARLADLIANIQVSGVSDEIHMIEFRRVNGDHSVMTLSPLPGT